MQAGFNNGSARHQNYYGKENNGDFYLYLQ